VAGGLLDDAAFDCRDNEVFRMEDYPSDWNLDWHGHTPGSPDWSETSRFIAYSLVSIPCINTEFVNQVMNVRLHRYYTHHKPGNLRLSLLQTFSQSTAYPQLRVSLPENSRAFGMSRREAK
jgi:hypothetical protein